MRDFNNDDWREVCQNIRKNIQKYNSENIELLRIYPDIKPLNEMAIDLKTFISEIKNRRGHIYNTICNICCLEKISSAKNHWAKELFDAFNELFDPIIKGGISKKKSLIKYFIEPCVSPITYEPEEDDLFIRAMNLEISKASKPNIPNAQRKLKEAKFIQEYILPNISVYRIANAERIATLLKSFLDAIEKNNLEIIKTAIDTFINTQTETNTDN